MPDGMYALKGAAKGLMAALRGVSGAKLAVRQARDERARHEAMLALENRKLELTAFKDAALLQLDRDKLAQAETLAGREQEHERGLQELKGTQESNLQELKGTQAAEREKELTTRQKELQELEGTQALELEEAKSQNQRMLAAAQAKLDQETEEFRAANPELANTVQGLWDMIDTLPLEESQKVERKLETLEALTTRRTASSSSAPLTNSQTAQKALESIPDAEVRSLTLRLGNRLALTDKEAERFYQAVATEFAVGNEAGAMRLFGDKFNDLDTSKLAGLRLTAARELVDIRSGLRELKELGVETGRLFSVAVEAMNQKDFNSLLQGWTLSVSGLDKLTPEQRKKATEVQTRITRHLVEFLKQISGAAVNEAEFARVQGMLPAIFKDEDINEGSIDGNLSSLRSSQHAYYSGQSSPKLAEKVLEAQGWDTIRLSTETESEPDAQPDEEPDAAPDAAPDEEDTEPTYTAIDGNITTRTELVAMMQDAKDKGDTREEQRKDLRDIFGDALSDEELETLLDEVYPDEEEDETETEEDAEDEDDDNAES